MFGCFALFLPVKTQKADYETQPFVVGMKQSYSELKCRRRRRLVLQHRVVHLVDVLRNLRGPTLERQRVVGVARLDSELGQDPDAIGELEGLVEHILALDISFGNSVDIVILQLP